MNVYPTVTEAPLYVTAEEGQYFIRATLCFDYAPVAGPFENLVTAVVAARLLGS